MKSPGREVEREEAKENYDELRKLAQNMGACLFGVADVTLIKDEFLLPSSLLKHLHRGICLAAPVSGEEETIFLLIQNLGPGLGW